jgi:glucan biosynthesis protein
MSAAAGVPQERRAACGSLACLDRSMFLNVCKPVAALARVAALALALAPCISAFAFNFNDVAKRAQKLSAGSYKPPQKNISKALESLSYLVAQRKTALRADVLPRRPRLQQSGQNQ